MWQQRYAAEQLDLQTVGDWLDWVAALLESKQVYLGHGTDNYWDEAVQLVLAALQLPPTTGHEILGEPVADSDKESLLAFLTERIDARRPLPYITGQAWFMQLPFYVDERVLIPRSPIGEWIQKRFSPWLTDPDSVKRVADIGTGSGCLAIGLALAFPQAQVDAVDICSDALVVTERNINDYELSSRIRAVQGDALSALEGTYDLIVSNPPYVPIAEANLLPSEYRYEPVKALYSGESGLNIVDTMLAKAYSYLNEGGILVLEVGQTAVSLVERYPQLPFMWLDCEQGGEGVLLLFKEQLPQQ